MMPAGSRGSLGRALWANGSPPVADVISVADRPATSPQRCALNGYDTAARGVTG